MRMARHGNPLMRPQYKLGHRTIDNDHADIATSWFHAAHCKAIQLPFLLARLKKLLRSHFEREAELMQKAGGFLCLCHQRDHQALLDLCDEATGLSERNPKKALALIRSKFPKLVGKHIVERDFFAVLFIHSNERIRTIGGPL
jgi:hemerythrin